MRSPSTSQIASKSAGAGPGRELLTTFVAVSGAAVLVAIVVALLGMLLVRGNGTSRCARNDTAGGDAVAAEQRGL